jgi:regulatory protein
VSAADSQPEQDRREARAAALNYLARREYACRELEAKLQQRGISPAVAGEVVEELQREKLVSDERFVEAYVRSRVGRLFGPLKIRAELQQRGIIDSLISRELDTYASEWQEAADRWAQSRVAGKLDRRGRARIYRSGKNRGFSHEHMMRALERLNSQG